MSVAAIVLAAGRGERLGPGVPKALRTLDGVPLVVHAVRAMAAAALVDVVVVAAPSDGVEDVRELLDGHGLVGLRVVAGGAERQESVALSLAALPDDVDVVLVHDSARALAPSALADAVVSAVLAGAAAVVPALAVADTIKRVNADGIVVETLDRTYLRAVQTPQGFRREVLIAAHEAAAREAGAHEAAAHETAAHGAAATRPPATDDAALVERLGIAVVVIDGSPDAVKVTLASDLLVAEAVLAHRRSDEPR